ncbi:MAG: multicopper oxidase family protein [Rhodobiaceae bacterium]|nr:multicopper oxidase family protein [Rhodobiaceae bacterium]MCC0062005.1 multicopper oxidase family protein [Rhodobiaceae bacterium]
MTRSVSRRAVIAGIGAGVAAFSLPRLPVLAAAPDFRSLKAAPATANLIAGGPGSGENNTAVWAYDGSVPGPLLRARVGERMRVRFENALEQESSIHWHGIRIDNAMDGVPGLTQDPVMPGGSFDYDFALTHPGTYWYHPHIRSSEQVGRGLHGILIVDEETVLDVDQDILLVIDDWRITENGQIHDQSFGALHDAAHSGRLGNWLTVNGASEPHFKVGAGERIRIRLVNVANSRIFQLDAAKLGARVFGVDGHGLETPEIPVDPVLLGPGQRADLIFDVAAGVDEISLDDVSTDEPVTAARFTLARDAMPARSRPPLDSLSLPRFAPEPDMANARRIDLKMEGGAMGGLATAMLDGEQMSLRDLAQKGYVWAFNGKVGRMHDRLFEARHGETIAIEFINETAWPHAMHLHGHHFKVLTRDGELAPDPGFRDTVLVGPEQRVGIAFVADNAGKWMLHCHMLEHQASGMTASFSVA